ncbi:MAG: biopolymer transporter ExbD [Prosthecobacter sp.]|uniref:ExbD/TolR family protein n=1 Tax=Prosthecobacter sp. TaxID=1965333 RepID=UPI0025DA1D31|nr:biopolymer transporter ExbD [Prosthecobacter sp.]MCF7786521.1 biopolymer transporter ExbD [Prosthecobacter sp.]
MAGGGGGGDGEPEFQIAPMIDVLLVLLIFFMSITSAQVLKVDKAITLPVAEHGIKKDNMRAEAIINVRWLADQKKAIYTYDDKPFTDMAKLSAALAEARKLSDKMGAKGSNPEFRVVIRGDREGDARSVSLAMNAAAEAGIGDVSMSTSNKE